jgi:hypothetical protein
MNENDTPQSTPPPKQSGAPKGNQNAVKPDGSALEARTFVYSTKGERNRWVRTASRRGLSLSEWLRGLGNHSAEPWPSKPEE